MKMKVLVITIHSILNYGSVLQTYALNRFLRDRGHDAQVIDYRPNYKKSIKGLLQGAVVKALFAVPYHIALGKFNSFMQKNIKTTKAYTGESLRADPPQSDVYVVGSDQVWNRTYPCGTDGAYYLDFVKSGKKVAYAASIGRSGIPQDELLQLKDNVQGFDRISFREKSAKEQMEHVGLTDTTYVFDPVFLLDKSHYAQLAPKPCKSNYLLIYTVEHVPMLSKAAEYIAKQLGLEVITIGGFRRKVGFGEFDRCAGPVDFLAYLQGASFILTSSFHCTAFSIILNRNFAVVLPPKNPERLCDILQTTGLEDKLIQDEKDFERVIKDVDFSHANVQIAKYREMSSQFILNAIES
jgi:hypothetical protein